MAAGTALIGRPASLLELGAAAIVTGLRIGVVVIVALGARRHRRRAAAAPSRLGVRRSTTAASPSGCCSWRVVFGLAGDLGAARAVRRRRASAALVVTSITRYSAAPAPRKTSSQEIHIASLLPQETAPRKRGRFLCGDLRDWPARWPPTATRPACAGPAPPGSAGSTTTAPTPRPRPRPTQEVRLTTGESKGDPSILNPEQLRADGRLVLPDAVVPAPGREGAHRRGRVRRTPPPP